MPTRKPARLFILNDAKDHPYLEALDRQLAILQTNGAIESWNKGDIHPGQVIKDVVDHQLKFADIVLLLVSSDFLASKECHKIKVKAAEMEKILIPILLRPCLYEYDEVIQKVSVYPIESGATKAVSTWDNQDEALTMVVRGIMEGVKKFNNLKRILFLSSDPKNVTKLDVTKEKERIKNALGEAYHKYDFYFDVLEHTTINSLIYKLLNLHHHPYIIHFSGHGSKEKGLVFENESGNYQLVEGKPLAELFEHVARKTECVILNACHSKVQGKEMIQYMNYAVGMNDRIKDSAAIQFSTSFYMALGSGKTIPEAFDIGKVGVDLGDKGKEHEVLELLEKG